jgi:Asp-tRNA(Asn)/Glu-tRNA(Gln) amidotransferase C subunit
VQKICATIIGAFKVVNDPHTSTNEKKQSVIKVTNLRTELDWLVKFTKDETEWCKTPELNRKMREISKNIEGLVRQLDNDFNQLAYEIDKFKSVFNSLLSVLEQVTDFFKQGHASEVCRVIDNGDDAFVQAKNLLNIEFPNLLVAQSKLLKEKSADYVKKTKALLEIQEEENEKLRKNFQQLLSY